MKRDIKLIKRQNKALSGANAQLSAELEQARLYIKILLALITALTKEKI